MPCKIEIRKTIDESISTLTEKDYWGFTQKQARPIVVKLNSLWGSIASLQQNSGQGGYRIVISRMDEAINREYAKQLEAEKRFERSLNFFKDDVALYEQEQKELKEIDKESSYPTSLFGLNDDNNLEFHVNTINVVSKFLENAGIEQRLVPEFLSSEGSVVQGAIAAANFINGTVDIIDDLNKRPSAWNKLPEEAAHWWYRLLDKNSDLKKALLTSAATDRKEEELRSSLYGETYNGPKVIGQLVMDEDGNFTQLPALSPIREEAIGQLIAEAIKRIEEKNAAPADYSFLKEFIKWINSLIDMFKSTEVDAFDVAAMKILSSDMTDLMTLEEYNVLNNQVYIDSVVSDQSVSPVDTSIISDLGRVEIITGFTDNLEKYPDGVLQTYRWTPGETVRGEPYLDDEGTGNIVESESEEFMNSLNNEPSPAFSTQEELNTWIVNNIPQYTLRQERSLQEVRDNQMFFDRLLNKTFRKRTKFLPKTIKRLYKISKGDNSLSQMMGFRPSLKDVELTKELTQNEKNILIHTNSYTNITPTLKVLPDVLKKYSKNPISLSEPLKMDTAKKQELTVINSVMNMIKEENPGKKSISSEDLAAEVSNYLKTNYLLGFANESAYESYRIDQTFRIVPDRVTDEDVDLTGITEEQLAIMPYAERQRLIELAGLTKKDPKVYHNKVSLRFNDKYFAGRNSHFKLAPSAWGNLTYFYTGDNKFKDAVLLHEIQNDNIEFLREFKPGVYEIANQLDEFKSDLNDIFLENIQILRRGGVRVDRAKDGWLSVKAKQIGVFEDEIITTGSSTKAKSTLADNFLSRWIRDNTSANILPDMGFLHGRLISNLQEYIDLYEGNNHAKKLVGVNETLDKLYSARRRYQDFFRKGGLQSVLTDGDIMNIEIAFNEAARYSNVPIHDQKDMFSSSQTILAASRKVNQYLSNVYGKDSFNGMLIGLEAPAKRGKLELNDSIKYFLYYNQKKTIDAIDKEIISNKKDKLGAIKAENLYNFQKNLIKITPVQLEEVIDNINYNLQLLDEVIDNQIELDLAIENKDNVTEERLIKEQEKIYNDALLEAQETSKKLSKKYENVEEVTKNILDIEMNYFTPLVHHLIQKHIKEAGKETPMYFSGFDITLLTQGNNITALIYAGKEEINIVIKQEFKFNNDEYTTTEGQYGKTNPLESFDYFKNNNVISKQEYEKAYQQATERKVKEIKKEAAIKLNLVQTEATLEEVNKALSDFKKKDKYNSQRISSEILRITNNKPIETGALYNAMTQVPGIKLVWQNSIKGLKGNPINKSDSMQPYQFIVKRGGIQQTSSFNTQEEAERFISDHSRNFNYNRNEYEIVDIKKEKPGGTGGYLVDLTNYNYNTPVLYGLEANKPSVKETEDVLKDAEVSPKVVAMLKDFLKRIGVNIKLADKIIVNGVKQNDKGIALLTQKLIQVVQGAGNNVVTEEAMHFAVEIIEQTDPVLFNKLLKEINSYSVYKDVLAQYSEDKGYQTKDGKPDIRKLKKEAISRVLTEVILQKVEGSNMTPVDAAKVESWWKQIIDALKRLFLKSGFDQAAMDIISGKNIGTVEDIRAEEGAYYLHKTGDKQTDNFNALSDMAKRMAPPKEEGGKYTVDGTKEADIRVSDIVRSFYDRKAELHELTKDEFKKAIDSIKKETGTGGHADIDYMAKNVFIDQNGYIRDVEGDDSAYVSQLNPNDRTAYNVLKNNLRERLISFGPKTRFLTEVMVYNPKRGNRSIAGTIDFIAIQKDGTVNLLDWKFMDLNTDKYDDIPWYKAVSWKMQMNEYKDILIKGYGFDPQGFGQTRMIPIKTNYSAADKKRNIKPQLIGVRIGDVDVTDIEDDYLLPVGIESESTGIDELDKLLEKLNDDYITLSEKPAKTENERRNKIEQLNALFTAIRRLQMKKDIAPLIKQAKILNERIQDSINKYNKNWIGTDPKAYTDDQLSDYSNELRNFRHTLNTYTSLDIALNELFKDDKDLTKEDESLKKDLEGTVRNARYLQVELEKVSEKFAMNFNYKREDIEDGNLPEKIIRGAARFFSSTALLQSRSIEAFFHKETRALTKAAYDVEEESSRLESKREEYMKLASSKGWTKKNYFDILKKKDKNELIDEFDTEFFTELRNHINEKDYTWIQDNIDKTEYEKLVKKRLDDEFVRIETKPRGGLTDTEANDEITLEKNSAILAYDISSSTGTGWLQYDLIKKAPLRSSWESKEFKELNATGNEAALDFYNYIIERNQEYEKIGYILRGDSRKFLPFARKDLLEKIETGGKISLGEQFIRSITVDEGDIGIGKFDKHTGEIINSIPRYFTKELDGELSSDLFKLMTLYNEMAIKFKYLQEIEGQVLSLIDTERNKPAINTSFFGSTIYKDGRIDYVKDNSKNSKLLENMVKSILYGQRYIQDESFDVVLGTIGDFGKNINKKLGLKIFPENLAGRQISGNKVISTFNKFMAQKTLGLSLLAPTSNLFGGTFQSLINAGVYFTKTDYASSELWLNSKMLGGVSKADREKFIAALQYFLPLTENYNREIAKKLSLNTLTQENIQDFLFYLMRHSEKHVQTVNFRSFLINSIVINGEVINAREYLRTTSEYVDMYDGTESERKAKKDKFEEDVEKMIEEYGIMKLSNVVDGKLVIPGIERKSDNVIKFRTKIQQLSVDALGNMTENQRRMLNMTIYGDSFAMFKNWIPRLADVRFGGMKYNAASDAYEWGRLRTVFSELSPNVFKSLKKLRSAMLANNEGVTVMRESYEKKKQEYERETGKKFKMTETQFMDMYRRNVRNTMWDAMAIISLLSIIVALKANAPDDDEDLAVKNQYKFLLRAADKLKDELTYFYDPSSFAQLISSGLFPSLQLITNFEKILENFLKYNYGLLIGDEEKMKSAHTFKYVMKEFPVTNQMQQYLPLFYPDLAKDLGIRVQSTSGFIR